MASPDDHKEAIKAAAKVAEAYAGSSASGHTDPENVLEKTYRMIIKLIDESRKQ